MRIAKLSILPAVLLVLAAPSFGQGPVPQPTPTISSPDPSGAADTAAPDEPGRAVARLSVLSGEASIKRGDSSDAVAAALNAPVMAGDSLAVGHNAAVELQFDSSHFARFAGDTDAHITGMDGSGPQIQLSRGLVTWRVLRNSSVQAEIQGPLVSIRPVGLAAVRVEVAADGSASIIARHGEAEVHSAKGAQHLKSGDLMTVRGTAADPEFQIVRAPAIDQWDDWSDKRDAYLTRAQSPKYVSSDIVGTEDLDNYGRWSNDPAYGDVWVPTVPATWAPYRDGRWVWQDYYGWTWVDYQPWGWAPFHYGSWYYRTGFGWAWYPGSRHSHYWYRPALVGFVGFGGGGFGVGFGFGNIGWIPLGPYERYHPWYGRGWYGGRNVVVNNINIVHNTNITNVYRNARVANGVTAVSSSDFQRGNFRSNVAVSSADMGRASMVRGAVPMTPTASHLNFSDRSATVSPRAGSGNQRFYGSQYSNAGNGRVPFGQQQASVSSAFQSRGMQTGSAGQRFGGTSSAGSTSAGTASGWNRFGQGSGGAVNQSGAGRSLNVQPPIVRQRTAPTGGGYGGGYNNSPYYGGQGSARPQPQQQQPGRQFGTPSSSPAPQYRQSAPAQQRSAPSPQPRSNGGSNGGGGGSRPSSGSGGGSHSNSGHGSSRR